MTGPGESLLERATSRARTFFFTGLLVVIPPFISLWLLYKAWDGLDAVMMRLLPAWAANHVVVRLAASLGGLMVPVLTVMAAGAAAQTYLGARFKEFYETLLRRLPIVGRIFSWIQQISEMVFTDKREVFTRVALIEYPRKGMWTLGFLSSPAAEEIRRKSSQDLVSLFVPTTPNPTSGFLLMIPAGEVVLLDMGPEDALKIILSGGIISPTAAAGAAPASPPAP